MAWIETDEYTCNTCGEQVAEGYSPPAREDDPAHASHSRCRSCTDWGRVARKLTKATEAETS